MSHQTRSTPFNLYHFFSLSLSRSLLVPHSSRFVCHSPKNVSLVHDTSRQPSCPSLFFTVLASLIFTSVSSFFFPYRQHPHSAGPPRLRLQQQKANKNIYEIQHLRTLLFYRIYAHSPQTKTSFLKASLTGHQDIQQRCHTTPPPHLTRPHPIDISLLYIYPRLLSLTRSSFPQIFGKEHHSIPGLDCPVTLYTSNGMFVVM